MIYLLRHGEDDETYIGGHSDVALTNNGILQIQKIADELKNSNYKIDRIISSDIKRAKQTAEIVNKDFKLPVEYTTMLRELDKGKLNGMLVTEANKVYPEYEDVSDINLVYPDGESMKTFYERIKRDVDKILALDNSLIVTHRGVINMLYFILNNIEPNMDKKQFGVTHASFHELDPVNKVIRKIR